MAGGQGNNEYFELVRIEGITFVEVDFTGSLANKTLKLQPCTLVDDNAVADTDAEIGEDDTIFTPLILIE